MSEVPASELIYEPPTSSTEPPHFRLLHYNDVYHLNPVTKQEPIGGASRFVTLTKSFHLPESPDVPPLLTFFSGDAFNPSLESSITKGTHMVPVLNAAQTDIACVGNHDLDFGVEQFKHLAKKCNFPWLCSNVEDPALGEGVSLAGVEKTKILESGGRKVGVIGVVEKEWLETVNSLPPGLKFIEPVDAVKKWVPGLREQGAELIVIVSHQREPNDLKLCEDLPEGFVDILLGGHDHHYAHTLTNNIHVLRSGCDFKSLTYLSCTPSPHPTGPRYLITLTRHNTLSTLTPDPETSTKISHLTAHLNSTLSKPIGHTSEPLDSLFTTVRQSESNLANFVCDLMRFYYSAPLSIMAGGTIRGDQIYPPGKVHLGDIINCFPFEDPVVAVRVPGKNFIAAIENGIAKLPALEGRFPHVSGCKFKFDSSKPPGERVIEVRMDDGELIEGDKKYVVVTRGYMVKGKDGFTALSHAEGAEDVVDEENGVLISMILRQYFLSLKVLGRWKRGSCFRDLFKDLKKHQADDGKLVGAEREEQEGGAVSDDDEEGSSEGEEEEVEGEVVVHEEERETEVPGIVRRLAGKWKRRALGGEGAVEWTMAIAPKLEGRVVDACRE